MINTNTMEPRQVWAAWKNQEITAGDLAAWQQRNNYYFNETGGRILARRLFHRLEHGFSRSEYIVLNDGNYYCRIYADSDADAIAIFEAGAYKPC